jgi:uncharacterized protein (TIGR02594 family)
MRFKNRMMLTVGCVCLLGLSNPAFSAPKKNGVEHSQRAKTQRNIKTKKIAQFSSKRHPNARTVRENRAARLVSMPIAEAPKRPALGWPALVSEARKYMGTNPTSRSRLWCATFMNLVLAKVGYAGTNSDAAKSFTYYGHRISAPRIGAIAVLTRGKNGGHVGVVSGIDSNGNPIIISGNHGRRVGEGVYPRSRVIAYVMPSTRQAPNTQVAERSQPVHAPSDSGIDSPITELLAAIDAEQNRPERPSQPAQVSQAQLRQPRPSQPERLSQPPRPIQPVPQARPAEPHLAVQQSPEPATVTTQHGRRALPVEPGLAEFLGITDRAQAAPPSRVAPLRQRQVQQHRERRIATTGLSGVFGLR